MQFQPINSKKEKENLDMEQKSITFADELCNKSGGSCK